MSHVFGMAHTLGGILDQIGGFFAPGIAAGAPPVLPTGFGFVPPPGANSVVDDEFGSGEGSTNGTNGFYPGGGGCAQQCGPTQQKFLTTVCPDGRVITRPYKSRKRKRRLASVSDIKDLGALKTVLGGGKAFENWIATRGR